MTPRPTRRSLPFDHGHRFYLHQKFRRSERRLNRRPRGFGVSEKFGIGLVHRRKIADIREVHRRFHDIGGGSAALLKDGREIFEHLTGLGPNVSLADEVTPAVHSHLAGGEYEGPPLRSRNLGGRGHAERGRLKGDFFHEGGLP